ncbi:hypothetical protein ACFV7R_29855 [Streptomyces sp. NPDC059866]|uniref:hypothetical protein n=1 Tax=Streptomyces sp. NPDC059866 TaxID=3346978 RepID=UPI0036529635
MLGRRAEAEDVVQEVRIRWSATGREDIAEPRAYPFRGSRPRGWNRWGGRCREDREAKEGCGQRGVRCGR